jgi:hypothetical protein
MPEMARELMVTWLKPTTGRDADLILPVAGEATRLHRTALNDSSVAGVFDSDARFVGWRGHPRAFMSPALLDAGAAGLPAGHKFAVELREVAKAIRAFAHDWAKGNARREHARERWHIVLGTLANRRHEIVHEALVTGPDMDLYARRLEEALSVILDRLIDIALSAGSAVRSVQDVIAWHKEPWA